MVDVVDGDAVPAQVYRQLLTVRHATAASLAERTGLSEDTVTTVLQGLLADGAVLHLHGADGERWEAKPPDAVLAEPIRAQEQRLAELRSVGEEFTRIYRAARESGSAYPGLDVVRDRELIVGYFRQLQAGARHHLKAIDRPPYVGGDGGESAQATLQAERLAAGVRYQVIYHDSVYADPVRCANVLRAVALGERARVLVDPPVKLIIADDERALVALDPAETPDPVSLLVQPSGLLNALVSVFEVLWRLAAPLSPEQSAEVLDDGDRMVLTLMAAGATDDAIARRLNLSRRSVVRRTSALLERLGAATRFQAGVQAARRGWL